MMQFGIKGINVEAATEKALLQELITATVHAKGNQLLTTLAAGNLEALVITLPDNWTQLTTKPVDTAQ